MQKWKKMVLLKGVWELTEANILMTFLLERKLCLKICSDLWVLAYLESKFQMEFCRIFRQESWKTSFLNLWTKFNFFSVFNKQIKPSKTLFLSQNKFNPPNIRWKVSKPWQQTSFLPKKGFLFGMQPLRGYKYEGFCRWYTKMKQYKNLM